MNLRMNSRTDRETHGVLPDEAVGQRPVQPPVRPPLRSRQWAAAVATVGGAASLAAGRLVTLPGGTPTQRLDQAAGHQGRIAVELVLCVFGVIAMAGGLVLLTGAIQERGRTLAGFGAAGSLLGCGVIVQMSLDAVYGAAAQAATGSTERRALVSLIRHLDASPAIAVVTPIAVLGYFFGPWLVTLGARRAGLVPAWLPWAILVALPLQSVGETLRGPFFANVADAVLQLLLVALLAVLVQGVLGRRSALA